MIEAAQRLQATKRLITICNCGTPQLVHVASPIPKTPSLEVSIYNLNEIKLLNFLTRKILQLKAHVEQLHVETYKHWKFH